MPFFDFWGIPEAELYTNINSNTNKYYNEKDPIKDRWMRSAAVDLTSATEVSPGRRLRAFSGIFSKTSDGYIQHAMNSQTVFKNTIVPKPITIGSLYNSFMNSNKFQDAKEYAASLPLRVNSPTGSDYILESIPESPEKRDPELHQALQDLGYEINEDIRAACFAFNDPNLFYPGVDEGIEPVSDDHVDLVIWGLQRELNRELRTANGFYGPSSVLPAVPLEKLPRNIQRALVERRRLRYNQWGITTEGWRNNKWSLWSIPEDADYTPTRQVRLNA